MLSSTPELLLLEFSGSIGVGFTLFSKLLVVPATFSFQLPKTENFNTKASPFCSQKQIGNGMYLAAKRAEAEAIINKATVTDLAGISNSFTRSRLRPFIQKHNLCAVYHIRLNAKDIQILLNLIHPYHIMIR